MADEKQKKEEETKDATSEESDTSESVKDEGEGKEKTVDELQKELAAAKAHNSKLNKENEKRRQKEKELETRVESTNKALKEALGLKDEKSQADEVLKSAKAQADAKNARILLKSTFTALAAKDTHNADVAFKALESQLKDVTVDLEAETVDEDAISEVLKSARDDKKLSFLFVQSDSDGAEKPAAKNSKAAPDSKTRPSGGPGTELKHYRQLLAAGNRREAAEYFAKNEKAIKNGLK